MKKELQDKLFKKYPKIFRQKDLPMSETCMCWGIACGDGWYTLIDNLCFSLQFDTDRNNYPQVEARQVKEKFGGLCFYYQINASQDPDRSRKCGAIEGMIDFAELMSSSICEECGSNQDVSQTSGWIKTVCKNCLKGEK
ncbi:MAG TPA: hypothetical protein VLB82_07710 [Thermodesulfobacteriota bacterium]|nr:hypothetical protein [Thermodesulfobacteriota bacterium]